MSDVIFSKKNVLVTGGAGFLGSHLCDALIKDSKVICLDNFSDGDFKNIEHLMQFPDFQFIKHDITEPINLEEISELKRFKIEFQGIQEIYNLACPTSPKNFEKVKIETIKANTIGIINMLELAVKYKSKFLQASSSVVYGGRPKDNRFLSEDMIFAFDQFEPRAGYDLGKKYAETIIFNYQEKYNIDVKIARIFRTYGPRERLGIGEMLPDFVDNALDNKDLIIYGDENFRTSLCYVSDVIDGLIRLMASHKDVTVVNIGNDQDLSLYDVCQKIIKLVGSSSKIKFAPPLLFMREQGLPDLRRAKESLGWIPIVTLETGLNSFIEYAKAQKVLLN